MDKQKIRSKETNPILRTFLLSQSFLTGAVIKFCFKTFLRTPSKAGGILLGRQNISNNNIIIEHHTEPMHGDYQTRLRFLRRDPGHLSFFQELYNNSNGTIGYIGEWHTHPEDIPQYSIIDLKNWRKIHGKSGTNQVQYHLIAGRNAVAIWKYSGKQPYLVKIASICWEDLI